MKNKEKEKLITIKEAAKVLNVSVHTLRSWDRTGELVAMRLGPKKFYRYWEGDVLRYLIKGA